MNIFGAISVALLLITIVSKHEGARILGLFPVPGKSHMNIFETLMKGLAEKGHIVDVLSHFPLKKPIPRYNDLSLKGLLPIFVNNVTYEDTQAMTSYGGSLFLFGDVGWKLCDVILFSPQCQQLKNTTVKYDLVITQLFGTDCFLGFAHHFKVPVIAVTSSVMLPWANDRFGNPDNPSYIPNYLLPVASEMSLTERVVNTLTLVVSKLGYFWMSTYLSQKYANKFFGPDLPDFHTLTKNTSLILVNSYLSLNGARPTSPNVIEIGGLHIKPPGKLAPHFEKIMDESPNGVIYFTMGSMVCTETFPIDKQRALIEAFGELPYTVLWKAGGDKLPGPIPSNIRFESWMPQMEILCHPNTKVFITHGGLLSTQEAVYCGVPLLGIPLILDPHLNIQTYVLRGIAEKININDLNKEVLLRKLHLLLDNSSYEVNSKKMAQLFQDRPMQPLDLALYWVEYVLRHNGAPHLRPVGAELPWYQYYLIDVISVLLTLLIFTVLIVYKAIKGILKLFCRRKGRKEKDL